MQLGQRVRQNGFLRQWFWRAVSLTSLEGGALDLGRVAPMLPVFLGSEARKSTLMTFIYNMSARFINRLLSPSRVCTCWADVAAAGELTSSSSLNEQVGSSEYSLLGVPESSHSI